MATIIYIIESAWVIWSVHQVQGKVSLGLKQFD